MTGEDEDEALARKKEAAAERLKKAWATPKSWRYWSAVNNTEVGLWYTSAAFFFMLFAGVLALIMRAQLSVPDNDLVSANLYSQLYTLHGSIMMFLFAVPIFEALSILIMPQMLGARDLPFPRLSAFGFWCFLIGGIFVSGSIFFGIAPEAGWFMYPPLTTQYSGVGADIWLLGLSFIEIASIAAAVELITGVLKCRPPGMRINLIPLFAWYVLVVGVMILFAFPPLIAGDILFEMERAFDWPFFDASRGGDPILWQHLFWIFGHPEVYIVFLPAIAMTAMIIPTFAQRPIYGYSWIVLSAVGTGFLSFALWVHHMYTVGLPIISQGFASAASLAVAIPTGIQIFAFIATLLYGRVRPALPLHFVFGALAIFLIGGLTGVMVALAPFDWQVHDSYFVVAHLHYTLIGGMAFSIIAGVYYFYPMMTSRMLSERLGRWIFWLAFVGFNVTFFPMHVSGMMGMPRRVFTYPADLNWDIPNLISSMGAVVFASAMVALAIDVFRPKKHLPYAPRNPWKAGTLEWLMEMPGQAWGVRSIPRITSRYPLWDQPDLMQRVDDGEFYLPDAEEGKRETLVTTVLDGEPLQCMRVPGPSFIPAIAAAFTGAAFIFATFHWYKTTIAATVLAAGAIIAWLWHGTAHRPEKDEKNIGDGLMLPLYVSGPKSCGWWSVFITMIGDMTAFVCLLFGYFFYWTIAEEFPPAGMQGPGVLWPLIGALMTVIAWLIVHRSRRYISDIDGPALRFRIAAASAFALAGGASLLAAPWLTGLEPTMHVYPAIVWVLMIWCALHVGIGVVMLAFCWAASRTGRLTAKYDMDLWNTTLYWHFTLITVLLTVAVTAFFPFAARAAS